MSNEENAHINPMDFAGSESHTPTRKKRTRARKSQQKPPDSKSFTCVKVRKAALLRIQLIAAYRNMSLIDYIDHLMSTQGAKDFQNMANTIKTYYQGDDNG